MTLDPDAAALRAVNRADVYQADQLAAHLRRDEGGRIAFSYIDSWIKDGNPSIATTLPVSREPLVTAAGAVPPFFAGLLPEGRRLGALRRALKTSADDELTLLLGVGSDLIGNVRVVPEGEHPSPVPPRLQVGAFDRIRFADILAEMDVRVDRVGLPGVQDKVSGAMLNLRITSADSPYLLKLNPREYKHLVENEHFFIEAARTAGIRTVDAELVHDADGAPGLAVTRFDRVTVDGSQRTLAVEDGCQVLGRYPAAKYGVTTERVLSALVAVCEAPQPAAAEFLAQITFAYLTGNGDAHAKNFSVMRDLSARWQPAPAYDLPSTVPYGDHRLALSIRRSFDNIPGSRFVTLGEYLGVRPRAARSVIDRGGRVR